MPRELHPTMEDMEALFLRLVKTNPGVATELKAVILERLLLEAEAREGAPEKAPVNGTVDVDAQAMQAAWAKDG